MELIIYVAVE